MTTKIDLFTNNTFLEYLLFANVSILIFKIMKSFLFRHVLESIDDLTFEYNFAFVVK
jgi:hypothetical protein